ncbi:MAG: glycosyltransferase family 2 protein [Anaerolineales bacterium]|nr:glycosyltransferase family 2 protein [Anaerolineales bacterium]
MDLSIVIVSWNTRDLLLQCLESVYQEIRTFPLLEMETWVVDNASTDDSVSEVREKYPEVKLILNQNNVGFAGGNNQAISQCSGRYVLLLNPDTVIKPNGLKSLIDFMDANPQAGAAGSMLLNPNGTLQTSCYPAPTLSREFWRLFHLDTIRPYGVYRMSDWDMNSATEVDVIQGASLVLRKEALEQVGLLDDTYFMYTEEVDLCYRLQKSSWLLYWVPESKVVHYGGQSTQQVATKMFLCLYESKLIFIRKHHGWLAAQAYKLTLVLATSIRLILSPLALLEKPSKRQHHLRLAGNYRRLLTTLPRM